MKRRETLNTPQVMADYLTGMARAPLKFERLLDQPAHTWHTVSTSPVD